MNRDRTTRIGQAGKRCLRREALLIAAVMALSIVVLVLTFGCAGESGSDRTDTTGPAASQGPEKIQQAPSSPSSSTSSTASPNPAAPSTSEPIATGAAEFGSPTSGDPYFPSNGNGGYDVQDYEISLEIDPVGGRIEGVEVVTAIATQDLAGFYLDLLGLDLATVEVDERAASFERQGQELKITAPTALPVGATFAVTLSYSGIPTTLSSKLFAMGWQKVNDTIFTLDEPQGAATWFAVNDTPADKATYTFRLTVPEPYVAAATGLLVDTRAGGDSRTFTWRMDKPMASYLAAVDVDEFVAESSVSAGGATIRNYFVKDVAEQAHDAFSRTGEYVDYFAGLFGAYPFAVYGVVVPDADTGAAMENQTMSLFGKDVVEKRMSDPVAGPVFLAHELAHQWFGNSVTIERWDDIWLNEGLATYSSWLWLQHDQGAQAFEAQVARARELAAKSIEPPPGNPGSGNMFGTSVYLRGALTVHALRQTVGDESFFRTLRTWAERYKYGNASTEDFIAVAKEEAPQVPASELDALFDAWLYQEPLPPQ